MESLKRRCIGALCAGIAAVGLAGCGDDEADDAASAAGGGTETLTFGLLTPLSGSAASWGEAQKTSVEIAIEKVNSAGGIKVGDTTYTLGLKVFDHAYDPTKAATVAREAFEQEQLKFVESLGGGVIAAVQPIAERTGALVFCSCLGTGFLGEEHPLTFKPFHDDAEALDAILAALKASQPDTRRIAHIYPDDDVGHGAVEDSREVLEKHGLQSSVSYVARDATDLYPVLTKVLRDKPDAIDVGPSPQGLYETIVKQAHELGFDGPFLFPDVLNFEASSKAVPAGALVGSLSAPCSTGAATAEGKEWAAAYRSAMNEPPQWWAAQDHDNVLLLAEAIRKAQSVEPDKVAEALGEVSIEGATAGGGTVSYSGEDRFGVPRAFSLPYRVCEVQAGGDGGRGVEKQVADA